MLGYSGEFYLYVWARDRVQRSNRWIMHSIKDNLILSAIASIGTALLLIGAFLVAGEIAIDDLLGSTGTGYLIVGGFLVVLVSAEWMLPKALWLKRHEPETYAQARTICEYQDYLIFHLTGRVLAGLAVVHFGRFFVANALQIVQWWVVVPEASFEAWATLLAVQMAANRIPFLPSRDLIFASLGIEMSSTLGIPVATVAGMLLVRSAIDRLLNAGLFGLTSVWEHRYGIDPHSVDAADEQADLAVASEGRRDQKDWHRA